jgi:hypothetical protein
MLKVAATRRRRKPWPQALAASPRRKPLPEALAAGDQPC